MTKDRLTAAVMRVLRFELMSPAIFVPRAV